LDNGRPYEIKEWLNRHPNVTHWISIEDDYNEEAYKEAGIGGHLIHTSFYGNNGGLQKQHVEEALSMLKEKII